jgi:malonate-semialdehyde dehydrogenase (acetylating)/methylmalonate-semialdehyde dehydrogenase
MVLLRRFSTSASRNSLSSLAKASAERLSEWRGTSVTGGNTKNFIGGEFVDSKTSDWIDVLDPVCNSESQYRSGRYIRV